MSVILWTSCLFSPGILVSAVGISFFADSNARLDSDLMRLRRMDTELQVVQVDHLKSLAEEGLRALEIKKAPNQSLLADTAHVNAALAADPENEEREYESYRSLTDLDDAREVLLEELIQASTCNGI